MITNHRNRAAAKLYGHASMTVMCATEDGLAQAVGPHQPHVRVRDRQNASRTEGRTRDGTDSTLRAGFSQQRMVR